MFKSRTIGIHVLRGALGAAFLAVALVYASQLGLWIILPLAAMALCFRGCPMCWTVGLIETALDRHSKGCADGSCATDRPIHRETDTGPASPPALP